jgi:hypothetical protein
MPPLVTAGALCTCSFGVAPAPLVVTPKPTPVVAGAPAATIQDSAPMVNIATFGMCMTPSNPVVAAATAAKLGAFTPAPCIPAIATPWTPGATQVTIGGSPALHVGCTAMCSYGGVITITSPGNAGTVQVS